MEFCDLFSIELREEGYQRCPAFIVTLSSGKTNKHGVLTQMGAIRCKEVTTCLLGGLAIYLFHRFELSGEAFPRLNTNKDWYNVKLLRPGGSDLTKQITYNTMLDWCHRLYDEVSIQGASVLHMPRKRVVQMAELMGVTDGQVRESNS